MSTELTQILCTLNGEKISIQASGGPQFSSSMDDMHTDIELVGTGYRIQLKGSEALRLVQAVLKRLNGDYEVHDLDSDIFEAPFGHPIKAPDREEMKLFPKGRTHSYVKDVQQEKAQMHQELHARNGNISEAAAHCGMTTSEFQHKLKIYNIKYEPIGPIDDLPF